jgi:O-methyltransferase involved in polyketide biosynthesis
MGDLSITALYTSAVWARARLPCADLCATRDARRVQLVTDAALALARRPPLRDPLLQRHAMIDHVLREARPRRVVELAAGLSPRGAAVSADGGVRYIEMDLPGMAAHKRTLLARTAAGRAVLARGNYELVAGDVAARDELPACDLAIAEGLLMYLDAPARAQLFAKVARAAAQLVFDLTPAAEEPPPGAGGRVLAAAMARFTGGRGFERDARTRAQILAELRAAGFADVAAIAAADVARAWQLPHAERATPTVVFTARARATPA